MTDRSDARGAKRGLSGFEELLDALPNAIFQVSQGGTVLACRIGRYTDAKLAKRLRAQVGAHVDALLAPAAASAVMAAVAETLDTGRVVSRVWEAGTEAAGNRTHWQGTFSPSSADSVLVLGRDVTTEQGRSDADRFLLELGRALNATPVPDLDKAVVDTLRSAADFLHARGALMVVPDEDSAHHFTIAHAWTPFAIPSSADFPSLPRGQSSWLEGVLEHLAEPVLIETAALPNDAPVLQWVAEEYGLAAIGVIPTVLQHERLGMVAFGFPSVPDQVSRSRLSALGPLSHLLSGVHERYRHETERWQRDLEGRFRSLVRHSADITVAINLDGRLSFVSDSVQALLGYAPADLIGKPWLDFLHPGDHQDALDYYEQLESGSDPARPGQTFRIRHRDGSWRIFEGILTDARDDPSVRGHVAIARDVTERVNAEAALRTSEARFRRLVENVPDAIYRWRVGPNQGFDYISPSVERLSGYSAAELIADPELRTRIEHPDDRAALLKALDDPSREHKPFRMRWLRRDGGITWTEHHVVLIRDDDGNLEAIEGIARDINDQVEATERLAQSERQFRLLTERATDMIYRFRVQPEPRLEYMSPAAAAITGYEPEELYADPSLTFGRIHPDDRDVAIAQIRDPHAASRRLRVRWRHKDGNWVWTDHRVVPFSDDDGHLIGAEGVARDVTEEVRVEEELLESDRLSRSVMESIPGPTVVLDAAGRIIMVNHAWETFMLASRGGRDGGPGVGADYVALCEQAAASGTEGAGEIAVGVRAVLSGAQQRFHLDYPAPGQVDDRWFLVKVSPLRTAHGGAVVLHSDITERKRYERELTHHALHDGLTGLPNRALLNDRLHVALRRAERRRAQTVGLIVVDLDRFKSVNDAFGHRAGDILLTAISARLTKLARPGDTVARLAGDKFVVLCEGITAPSEVATLAQRIVKGIAMPLDEGTPEEVVITASVGVTLGGRDADGDALLRDADAAMYQARKLGRNCYALFDKRLHVDTLSRRVIEADLRRALERDELRLVYQPVVDLHTETITGVEALLRWQHPSRGLLGPGEFLEAAEETGLIVPIGDWVLREACRQQCVWTAADPERRHVDMAVNVCAQQIRRPQFVETVLTTVADSGLRPDSLVLELTETALMEADVTPNAGRLHEAGIRLAVDDFGIAYSALNYLKRFPVDIMKIDKSFIDGLQRNPEDPAIIEAIISMTRALGLTTIAEGVEQAQQRDTLLALGCERAQGYFFSRPRPASVIAKMLRTGLPPTSTRSRRTRLPHLPRHG